MIEIDITKDMIEQCKAKAQDIGRLKNSITKGQGNLAGIVGEYIVHKYLKDSVAIDRCKNKCILIRLFNGFIE